MKKVFSLVELIVAILIVGILASVMILLMRVRIDKAKWSIPNYQGYSKIEGTPGLPFQNLPAVNENPLASGGWIRDEATGEYIFTDPNTGQITRSMQKPTIIPGWRPQLDPFEIVDNNFQAAQRSLFNYFDQARHDLDQQDLDPKEYLRQVDALHENIRKAEFTLKQQAEAKVESMGQIIRLMEEKRLDINTGQRALFRLAGVDQEVIDSMFPQPKVTDPEKIGLSRNK